LKRARIFEVDPIFRAQIAVAQEQAVTRDHRVAIDASQPQLPADPIAIQQLRRVVVERDPIGQFGLRIDLVIDQHGCEQGRALGVAEAARVERRRIMDPVPGRSPMRGLHVALKHPGPTGNSVPSRTASG
jgi:hypothetical protein